MNEFKELNGKIVERLFIVLWSPWGEEDESDIDISFGFVFKNEPNQLCIVSVDKDQLWSPQIIYETLPERIYSWEKFYPRIKMWMKAEDENLILGKEYYDVTKSELFDSIIDKEIDAIELLYLEENPEPFGVKFIFKDDYIISTPNLDGNAVQSKKFNLSSAFENFQSLGNIIHSQI